MNFGEKLQLLLDEHGMKQSELGQKIGLASGNVSNWVNGVSMPKVETLLKICNVFGVTPNEMLGFDEATLYVKFLENKVEKLNNDLVVWCEQLLYVQEQLKKLKGE